MVAPNFGVPKGYLVVVMVVEHGSRTVGVAAAAVEMVVVGVEVQVIVMMVGEVTDANDDGGEVLMVWW